MKKILLINLVLFSVVLTFGQSKNNTEKTYTESFMVDSCTFVSSGINDYFILEPNFQLILQGKDDKDSAKLIVTVLNDTRKIGNIETRIVEEHESVNGITVEISRNYFALCKETGSIFYFGEEVDIYKDGKIINHEGAWIAEGKNKAGIAMPGQILIGSRYYQEIAPGVAMDRAEIISFDEKVKTPAGEFINCLRTEETNAVKPKDKEYKLYAPGIGLIQDEELLLVKYGYIK